MSLGRREATSIEETGPERASALRNMAREDGSVRTVALTALFTYWRLALIFRPFQSALPEPPPALPSPTMEQFRQTLRHPIFAAFLAGGVAGAVSRTVVSPLERLKILFQIQSVGREEYKLSVGRGLAKMWREEGWRGFMRGNGTNCIRIVPYSAVQFGSYSFYKRVSTAFAHTN